MKWPFKKQKIDEINELKQYKSLKDIITQNISSRGFLRTITIFFCLLMIVALWYVMIKWTNHLLPAISQKTISIIGNTTGEPMIMDENGNINTLLIGFWWHQHQGWFLTDTIMIVSYNPNTEAITMLSIPRDFYVNKDNIYFTRINALLAYKLNQISDFKEENFDKDFEIAAWYLKEKVEEISWLKIPYYVGVSFPWFIDLIDHLWGLEINVPEPMYDNQFPDKATRGYEPFKIEAWLQILDGETALKYARSRKTTSDFSRSYRQQQIISALTNQIKSQFKIHKIKQIEDLYNIIQQTIYTNVSVKNVLFAGQFKNQIKHFFSFVLTYECGNTYTLMEPGCLLYTPSREDFGGQSILIPFGSYVGKLSYYQKIQEFTSIIAHHQGMLIEAPQIIVENAIDNNYAHSKRQNRWGKADLLALKLIQYGIPVKDATTSEQSSDKTIVYTYGKLYPETIKVLKLFMNFEHIPIPREEVINSTWWDLWDQQEDVDIRIVLWNDFIDQLNNKTHIIMH